jgi:rubredoxin
MLSGHGYAKATKERQMPHLCTRSRAPQPSNGRAIPEQWRCTDCNRLLGTIQFGRLHVRFTRGHEYIAALPATCTCRRCGTLNRLGRS